jgi:hypothetical protein
MQSQLSQLNTTDLLELADLKDLISEGKRNEAMPGLYALAAKYPQSPELQGLIRVSLNPETLAEPEAVARRQQPPPPIQLIAQPQWGAPPPAYQPQLAPQSQWGTPPIYQSQPYYQPYSAPTPGYSATPYQQISGSKPPGGGALFLYFLAWFIGTIVSWVIIFYIGGLIENNARNSGLRDINQARTYSELYAYTDSALAQVSMIQTIEWVVAYGIVLITTVWLTFDTVQRRARFGPQSGSHPFLVFILCILFWIIAFPLMMTDRYRAKYLYSANSAPTPNVIIGTSRSANSMNTVILVVAIVLIVGTVFFTIIVPLMLGPQIGNIFSGVSKGIS